jgi:hypothetical protein
MGNNEIEALSNIKWLWLNWLIKITPKQAEILSNWKVEKLEMLSLRRSYEVSGKFSSMSNYIVNKLAESETLKELYIVNVRLTPKQQEILKDKISY